MDADNAREAPGLNSARRARDSISRFILNYRFATDQLLTKVQILKTEFEHLHDYSPIEHVTSRVKSVKSIVEKARRREIPLQQRELQTQMHDIAGETKDYIAAPKPNGYRSLHLIVRVPVFLSASIENVLVEIQLRTVAMDFWASWEHKIDYKYGATIPADLTAELTRAATHTSELDETMQRIHNRTLLESPQRPGLDGEIIPTELIESYLKEKQAEKERGSSR